jgi:hypothetical protein
VGGAGGAGGFGAGAPGRGSAVGRGCMLKRAQLWKSMTNSAISGRPPEGSGTWHVLATALASAYSCSCVAPDLYVTYTSWQSDDVVALC